MRVAVLCLILLGFLSMSSPAFAQNDRQKVLIVDFNIKDGKITYLGSRVVYNYPPEYLAHRDFDVKLLSKTEEIIKEFGISDPRIIYHEEGAAILDDVNFSVIVPFYNHLKDLEIYNVTTKEIMISVDLTNTIGDFCKNHPQDPDCKVIQQESRKSPGFEILFGILALLTVFSMLRKF